MSERADGYRERASGGPRVRTDIVDVYVFRDGAGGAIELLQLRRAGPPLEGSWHPVMGHVEPGETASACARRELGEEVGLAPGDGAWLGFWALERTHPYYVAAIDSIVLSPRFAAQVRAGWEPRLNVEHTAHRWVVSTEGDRWFVWPGQREAVREVVSIARGGPERAWLALPTA